MNGKVILEIDCSNEGAIHYAINAALMLIKDSTLEGYKLKILEIEK